MKLTSLLLVLAVPAAMAQGSVPFTWDETPELQEAHEDANTNTHLEAAAPWDRYNPFRPRPSLAPYRPIPPYKPNPEAERQRKEMERMRREMEEMMRRQREEMERRIREDPSRQVWKDMWFQLKKMDNVSRFLGMLSFFKLEGYALAHPDQKLTLLVPSDKAFEEAFDQQGKWMWPSDARQLIKYHTIPGEAFGGGCYTAEVLADPSQPESRHFMTKLALTYDDAEHIQMGELAFEAQSEDAHSPINVYDFEKKLLGTIPRPEGGEGKTYNVKTPYGCIHVVDSVFAYPYELREKGVVDWVMDLWNGWRGKKTDETKETM